MRFNAKKSLLKGSENNEEFQLYLDSSNFNEPSWSVNIKKPRDMLHLIVKKRATKQEMPIFSSNDHFQL